MKIDEYYHSNNCIQLKTLGHMHISVLKLAESLDVYQLQLKAQMQKSLLILGESLN